MKSNAPGQLLGFSMQYPRALYHLLRSAPKDVVCVEVLGDVATLKSDGELLAEEDKSSIVGNPLTDKSTDLWKTFSNWIEAIKDGFIDVEKTKFLLYTNRSGREGIVNKFSSAEYRSDIQSALEYTKKKLGDIKSDHDIWTYYDFVVNRNEALLFKIIQRFELQIGNGAGYEEVRIEIQRKHVPEGQIEFLMENLSGWVQKVITEKIVAHKCATISWEEFDRQFKVIFDRSRCRELIDFTMHYSKEHDNVQKHVKNRPIYLRQLESIELDENEILDAISDYLRADINFEKWIANEIIDDEIALDFEDRLTKFWGNQRKRIEITEKKLGDFERGQLLLVDCKSRAETIRDMTPPPSTIPGAYHALADDSILGWHPNWDKIFPKEEGI
ncbi:ABC-three component system protein [Paenibacillus nitricinens]|uniref:ABC-three component system protein n=1 Tax=Paenibacillus nitricinens TaxID=3367691 RepID=UPI003F84F63C